MRWVVLLSAAILATLAPCFAQEKIVQTFDGSSPLTTPVFQVQDKWEARWDCPDVVSITVLAGDGSLVAAAAGSHQGSLYLPRGGAFSLRIAPASPGSAWHITVAQAGDAAGPASIASNYLPPPLVAASSNTAGASAPATNAAPTLPQAPNPSTYVAPPPSMPSMMTIASSTGGAPGAGNLTDAQAHAVVVIKGDRGEGTGFLVTTPDGPAVVTNQHVLSANPNVKIFTTSGAQVQTIGLKGAADRDLAMIAIRDDHYTYLTLATDIAGSVQVGDEVVTPGNSEGGEVLLDTRGTVLGIGPQRIEISNPVFHGNSGGPIFHLKSGKVIAVVTEAVKVRASDDVDRASAANKDSAITGTVRYFGLRPDDVPTWERYDWNRFLDETAFILNFHDLSRCLDSFLNGAQYERQHVATSDEFGPPNAQYFLKNAKIQAVRDNFRQQIADADTSQKLDASREIVMDLEGLAATDLTTIQNPDNFYLFDRQRVAYEIKYRQALEKEIQNYGDHISDLGH